MGFLNARQRQNKTRALPPRTASGRVFFCGVYFLSNLINN